MSADNLRGFLEQRLAGYEAFLEHNQPCADAAAALYYATVAVRAETLQRALEAFDADGGQT